MEVYVNDILVKVMLVKDLICDLEEIFTILRQYRMQLNPKKCIFAVKKGNFLGYMVTERGIEVNFEKVEVV